MIGAKRGIAKANKVREYRDGILTPHSYLIVLQPYLVARCRFYSLNHQK